MDTMQKSDMGRIWLTQPKLPELSISYGVRLPVTPTSRISRVSGKWTVDPPICDLTVEYLKESGVPRTSLYTSFYFETNKPPQKGDDGTYTIPFGILPDGNTALFGSNLQQNFSFSLSKTPELLSQQHS